MFRFHRLSSFSKTRLGQNLLGAVILLFLVAVLTTQYLSLYNRAHATARASNEDEANGRAIEGALGFRYTALIDKIGDAYVDKGTGVLSVEPGGPFAKAGLKKDDRIRLGLLDLKVLLPQRRGKTIVLPVERSGHRFEVTVTVPRFTVPYP